MLNNSLSAKDRRVSFDEWMRVLRLLAESPKLYRRMAPFVRRTLSRLPYSTTLARRINERSVERLRKAVETQSARRVLAMDFKKAARLEDPYGQARARMVARRTRAHQIADFKKVFKQRLTMATREPPKPLKPQFSAAASRTQNIKVPPEIKNHKPAPVPKPPGSVAASVQKQVREQNAVRNSQSASATKQATQAPRQSFSTTQKFNSQSNSLTHQFNTKARGR